LHGAVVQLGSHSQLLADPDGAYAALLRAQDGEAECEPSSPLAISVFGESSADDLLPAASTAADSPYADAKPAEQKVATSRLWSLAAGKATLLPVGVLSSVLNGAVMPAFALSLGSIIAAFYLPHSELKQQVNQWWQVLHPPSHIAAPLTHARAASFSPASPSPRSS
jgi:ATP-binding cassette subfamily B (MDR/TAP) protein 1